MRGWLAAMVVSLAPSAGAEPLAERLADALRAETGAPGVAAAWSGPEGDGLAVAGLRAAGSEAPVAAGDLWHVGSNTKAMTAALVARLAAQGRIARDDTLGAALGPLVPDMHPAWAEADFAALLSHRAGLPRDAGRLTMLRLALPGPRRDPVGARLRYARAVLRRAPERPLGEFHYSNAGYVLAGAMLEARTGTPWRALMRQELFAPLGLDSAGFGPPQGDQPRGHKAGLPGGLRPVGTGALADNPPALGPAGRVHMSAADLRRWLELQIARPDWLPGEAWDWLHHPAPGTDYVAGWGVGPDGRHGHSGSNGMWFNRVAFWPEQGLALVLAANAGGLDSVAAFDRVEALFLAEARR